MLTGDEERIHSNTSNGSGRSAMNNPDRELGQELLGPQDAGNEKIEWDPFFGPPIRKGEVPPGPKPWENDKGKSVAGLRVNPQEIANHQRQMAVQAEQINAGRQRGISMRQQQRQPGGGAIGGGPQSAGVSGSYSARPPPGPPLGPAASKSVGGGYQPPQIGAANGGAANGVSAGGYHADPQKYIVPSSPPVVTNQPGQYQPVLGAGAPPQQHMMTHGGADNVLMMGGGLAQPHHQQQQQQQMVFAKLTFRDGYSAPYVAPFQIQFGEWVVVSGQRAGEVANVAAVTTVPPPVPPAGQIERKATPQEVAAAKNAPPPSSVAASGPSQQQQQAAAPVFYAKVKPLDAPALPVLVGKHKVQPGDKVCISCLTPDDECTVEAVTTVPPPGVKVTAKIVEVIKPELVLPNKQTTESDSVESLGLDEQQSSSTAAAVRSEQSISQPNKAGSDRAVRQSSAMSL